MTEQTNTDSEAFIVFSKSGTPITVADNPDDAWLRLCRGWDADRCREYFKPLGYYEMKVSIPNSRDSGT